MTRLFSLLLLFVGITTFATAQSGTYNPKEPNNGSRGIVYDRETAFDLTLFGNGYEFGLNIGRLKTYYRTEYFHFGIGELKHNREFKNRDGIVGGGSSRGFNNRSYVFGKQNNFYTLRANYGIKRYYTEKARKKGLSVGVSYEGGATLGILKPYFLEVNRIDPDNPGGSITTSVERFNGDNADVFLNTDLIFGAAPGINGLNEISFRPGINFSGALHFDWGAFDQYVKAVEVGFAADIFISNVPILIDSAELDNGTPSVLPENVRNRPYFLNLYISFQLGKRY